MSNLTSTSDLGPAVSIQGTAAGSADGRPYPPSWVNRLTGRIDALLVPSSAVYLAIGVAAVIAANAQNWIAGTVSFPGLAADLTYWGALGATLLALIPYLDRVATASLDVFQPALEGADLDLAAVRYELTVIPARPALVVTALAAGAVLISFVSNPVGSGVEGLPPLAFAIAAAGESVVLSLLFVLMYHTLRQLRAVARIHALAPHVNLFRPAPLYAFSQLTVRTAIAFVVILSSTVLLTSSRLQSYPVVIVAPFLVGGITVAVAAFVVPLQGMHRRISAEKKDLEWQAGQRLQAAMAEVHRAVDARDLSEADGLNKLLASLIAEREMLARLPTWPWQPGTVGAFVTAIILPIALFLVTRELQRLV